MKSKNFVFLALICAVFLVAQVVVASENPADHGLLLVFGKPLKVSDIFYDTHDATRTIQLEKSIKIAKDMLLEKNLTYDEKTEFYMVHFTIEKAYNNMKKDGRLEVRFDPAMGISSSMILDVLPKAVLEDSPGVFCPSVACSFPEVSVTKWNITPISFKNDKKILSKLLFSPAGFYICSLCLTVTFFVYALYKNPSTLHYFIKKIN